MHANLSSLGAKFPGSPQPKIKGVLPQMAVMKRNNHKTKDTFESPCSLDITVFPVTKGPFFIQNQIAKALGVHQDAWELW